MDSRVVGVLSLEDTVRRDADEVVRNIAELMLKPPILLTGDSQRAAKHLANSVGIADVRADLLPDAKVAAARRASGRRRPRAVRQ
ncbi:hypothetical protein AU191_20275 [Mycolicibacterium acapulense]|nr:hypothetical protein AU191_20275 [Mycolicibacterium acapulense]